MILAPVMEYCNIKAHHVWRETWSGAVGWISVKEVATVPEIVAKYLGTDCNGFVGNYIARKFPDINVEPDNPAE